MNSLSKIVFGLALAGLCLPRVSQAQDTQWLVAPYVWLAGAELEQSSDDGSTGGGSIDLLDKTDAAGMIRIEAIRNRWGLTLDYIFLNLSDSAVKDLPPPLGPGSVITGEVDLDVVELGAVYRASGMDEGLEILFGIRNIGADKVLLVTPAIGPTQRFDGDDDFTDVFAGARYLHRFTYRWDLALRGDYSGGDTEGVVNLLASIGFRFNDLFALNLGYRHVILEYETTDDATTDEIEITLSGPVLGFLFRF